MEREVVLKAETAEPGITYEGSSSQSTFVHFLDAEGEEMSTRGHHRTTESLRWDEIIRLPAVRKLREAPTAVVETELGKVLLRGHGIDKDAPGSPFHGKPKRLTDLVSFRNLEIDGDHGHSWHKHRVPLVVNGCELNVAGMMQRRDGVWECDWSLHTDRVHRRKDGDWHATPKMREKILEVMARELGAWLERHPHWLEEARAVVLNNKIAGVEGEIIASKVRYQRACELREKLRAEERGPYDLEIG